MPDVSERHSCLQIRQNLPADPKISWQVGQETKFWPMVDLVIGFKIRKLTFSGLLGFEACCKITRDCQQNDGSVGRFTLLGEKLKIV